MQNHHDTAIVGQLLSQLLSVNSPHPEFGARLKQRLKAAYLAGGFGHFDEKVLGYQKFSEYLKKVHGDLVSINRPGITGDILVSLKSSSVSTRGGVTQTTPTTSRAIRTAVWQAFANPDPLRKRFLDTDGNVVHYIEGSNSVAQQQIEACPERYVAIPPITQATQSGWMREFLDSISVHGVEKALLEQMIAEPYSSTLNATFTRALGNHGRAWSQLRTARVTSIIRSWAHENSIDFEVLYARPAVSPSVELASVATATASASNSPTTTQITSPREQVNKLLELLSDDDLERLVLPTLLSTIMIKSRL